MVFKCPSRQYSSATPQLLTEIMAFKVKNIFITGGNRGIGLGLVKGMLEEFQPVHLFATYRTASSSEELLDLAVKNSKLHPIEFEVTDYDRLSEIVQEVQRVTGVTGINLLINNAAILERDYNGIQNFTADNLRKHMEVNTIAPIMLTQAFLPLLEMPNASSAHEPEGIRRAAIINITSCLASISEIGSRGFSIFSYRVAKTALNMATKCISLELKDTGIITILLHPGRVKTDMGSERADMTIEDSVNQMLNVLKSVTTRDNGKFLEYSGQEIPW